MLFIVFLLEIWHHKSQCKYFKDNNGDYNDVASDNMIPCFEHTLGYILSETLCNHYINVIFTIIPQHG